TLLPALSLHDALPISGVLRLGGVRWTVVVGTITALGRVAGACGGPAYGRALGVARAVRARAGARLGDVAVPGRGAAHGSGGLERSEEDPAELPAPDHP